MTDRTNESAKPAISLLGAPRIDLKGEPVALPRRRTRALLYFLAASPGDHGRDELVDLLWPNLDPVRGAGSSATHSAT
jgi:DNA-binding SARP family transcriptional activator